MDKIHKTQFNEDKQKLIKCPWCNKFMSVPKVNGNVILVYVCHRCAEPIIFFKNESFKINRAFLDMDSPEEIEDYVIDFLIEEGLILQDDDSISVEEIQSMRKYLTNLKIPMEGDFL